MSEKREVDEFHGVGGSYLLDPRSGKRRQVEKPTVPSPGGGARDKDGELLDKPHDKLEPAFAAPEVHAPAPPVETPAVEAPRGKGLRVTPPAADPTEPGKGV